MAKNPACCLKSQCWGLDRWVGLGNLCFKRESGPTCFQMLINYSPEWYDFWCSRCGFLVQFIFLLHCLRSTQQNYLLWSEWVCSVSLPQLFIIFVQSFSFWSRTWRSSLYFRRQSTLLFDHHTLSKSTGICSDPCQCLQGLKPVFARLYWTWRIFYPIPQLWCPYLCRSREHANSRFRSQKLSISWCCLRAWTWARFWRYWSKLAAA